MCGKYVKFYFIAVRTEKLFANDGSDVHIKYGGKNKNILKFAIDFEHNIQFCCFNFYESNLIIFSF
jgi:hypothetical protein